MIEESAQATISKVAVPAYAPSEEIKDKEDKAKEDGAKKDKVEEDISVSQAVVKLLEALQITESYGVSGGAMATLWAALFESYRIQVIHCRHESGATFAAAESSLVSGKPVAAFCTAGPGLTNALTGYVCS